MNEHPAQRETTQRYMCIHCQGHAATPVCAVGLDLHLKSLCYDPIIMPAMNNIATDKHEDNASIITIGFRLKREFISMN